MGEPTGNVVITRSDEVRPEELENLKNRLADIAPQASLHVAAHEAAHGREPDKTWPTPVNTFDPSPPGCLDYVFVAGARVLEAGLAFATPHPNDENLFPSDHLGVMAKVDVG